jgi:hypothetical protein
VLPTLPIRFLTCNLLKNSTNKATAGPTLPPPSPPSPSNDENTALAIGLGVGLSCLAVFAGAAAFWVHRRRRASAASVPVKHLPFPKANSESGSGDDCTASDAPWASVDARAFFNETGGMSADWHHTARVLNFPGVLLETPFTWDESGRAGGQITRLNSSNDNTSKAWEIDANDVHINVNAKGQPIVLGKGAFGDVYQGTLRGVQLAAIKMLSAEGGNGAEAAFHREAAILKHVNRDRNIVQLYGTSRLAGNRMLLVMELMEGGDLRRRLSNPTTSEELQWHRQGKAVALDIARGLTALHAVNVVHRDIKSKNVLLTKDMCAKIGDVGIAAVHSKGYLTASAGRAIGTLAWSAPEMLLGTLCTNKADIYR